MMMNWTDEAIKKLRTMWEIDKWSASQIAAELGEGVTRSAVIGKVHRLGLTGRPRTAKPRIKVQPAHRVRATKITARSPEAVAEEQIPDGPLDHSECSVGLMELTSGHCCWPVAGQPVRYCGAPRSPKHHYCKRHAIAGRRELEPRRTNNYHS